MAFLTRNWRCKHLTRGTAIAVGNSLINANWDFIRKIISEKTLLFLELLIYYISYTHSIITPHNSDIGGLLQLLVRITLCLGSYTATHARPPADRCAGWSQYNWWTSVMFNNNVFHFERETQLPQNVFLGSFEVTSYSSLGVSIDLDLFLRGSCPTKIA